MKNNNETIDDEGRKIIKRGFFFLGVGIVLFLILNRIAEYYIWLDEYERTLANQGTTTSQVVIVEDKEPKSE